MIFLGHGNHSSGSTQLVKVTGEFTENLPVISLAIYRCVLLKNKLTGEFEPVPPPSETSVAVQSDFAL